MGFYQKREESQIHGRTTGIRHPFFYVIYQCILLYLHSMQHQPVLIPRVIIISYLSTFVIILSDEIIFEFIT